MKSPLGVLFLLVMASPLCAGGIPGLKVTFGEPVEIIPNTNFAHMFQFRDGRIAVNNRISSNGGKTWESSGFHPGTSTFEFPDNGDVISSSAAYHIDMVSEGVFETTFRRSTDGGGTFAEEQVRLNIPDAVMVNDDCGNAGGPCVDHAIVQLRDGSLLMSMYANFKNDTVPIPGFPPEWNLYKYRSWVVRSIDRGQTWDYRSTIAYGPSVGVESFCEPELLTLPNKDILCFMRTAGNQPYGPLYMNVSHDDGLTWTTPASIAENAGGGVWPHAVRMQNGLIALTSGRPDSWLAFSADDGKTWTDPLRFLDGDWGATTSYNSIAEISPGKLLVVYDDFQSVYAIEVLVHAPEPSAVCLLGSGVLAILLWRRFRR